MTYDRILAALADPTRRAVLDRLRDGPRPVGRIAEGLPVSRPAVSQHLKALLEAGLVERERQGTRNLYALAPGGAEPLAQWLGALVERRRAPEGGLRREVVVPMPAPEAWAMLTEDLSLWWPVGQVSQSAMGAGALPQAVTLEAVPGGRLREVLFDGTEGVWAEVEEAGPRKLAFRWRLGVPGRVEWTAVRDPGGARVAVEHDDAAAAFMWDLVLVERFGAAARASLSNF
ncbi:metalloregulator ArsR/SmtB family transcription factor [Jannaschia sp. W003]|uniref:ArsR/SmtB family transcription factor n=1 Tax=Jannaschia sp. W003 TaxID=2867012 RepID=UPI0021A2F3DE|nr:metalloregulator ArsR/SmtB family transcription factor [Jannaschia sp. W003]UWQ21047.1 metalloregulator ArsR/SmtB family transcription factor [Jannaschia sp. W003]